MVMPCSRSASRPSVKSERSSSGPPRRTDARSTAASWSSWMTRRSYNSLPISVLLPSSTLPAVANLRGCMALEFLKITFFFSPLHGRFRSLIVHAGRAALGQGRRHRFLEYFFDVGRARFDRAGAGDVADGAKTHRNLLDGLAGARGRQRRDGHQQAAPANHGPRVREVDRGDLEPLARDVLPDVELGPVADRKHT